MFIRVLARLLLSRNLISYWDYVSYDSRPYHYLIEIMSEPEILEIFSASLSR